MARPLKQGLDYFPFDVDFFSDEKVAAISGEFGIKGEIAAIKLLCAVYRNGYFAEWNEMLQMKLLKELPGISIDLLRNIVTRLVKWGFFDENLFNTSGILTSRGIQKRYFAIAYRRNSINGNLPYVIGGGDRVIDSKNSPATGLLIAKTQRVQDGIFEGKRVIDSNNPIIADKNTPTEGLLPAKTPKVKESKYKGYDVDDKERPSSPSAPESRNLKRSFEENMDECLKDQVWQEMAQMSLNLTKMDWKKAFLSFRASLIANGHDTEKTRQDFRQHFVSWYRINESTNKRINENGRNNQKNNSGNDRARVCTSVGGEAYPSAHIVPEGRGVSVL